MADMEGVVQQFDAEGHKLGFVIIAWDSTGNLVKEFPVMPGAKKMTLHIDPVPDDG